MVQVRMRITLRKGVTRPASGGLTKMPVHEMAVHITGEKEEHKQLTSVEHC